MTGYHDNLVRIGMTFGFWLGLGAAAVDSMFTAVVIGVCFTVLTAGFVAWEWVHRA